MKKLFALLAAGFALVQPFFAAEEKPNAPEAAPKPAEKLWYEKIKVGADFRLRHEYIDDKTKAPGAETRSRSRIRARVTATGKVSDDSELVMRFATGTTTDPTSTNQTLGDNFAAKPFNLDLAYLKSKLNDSLTFYGGKIKNPYVVPGESELIWDGDLNPEGAALQWQLSTFFLNAGAYWALERSAAADASLVGMQTGFQFKPGQSTVTAGVGLFDFGAVQNRAALSTANAAANYLGNSSTGAAAALKYKYDYQLSEFFAEWKFWAGSFPLALYLDYVKNGDPGTDETGWLCGVGFGKANLKGTWETILNYRRVEKDAVLAAFTDSDFIGGGTDGKGLEFQFGYMFTDKFKGAIDYFDNSKVLAASKDYRRAMFDLSFKI